MAARIWKLLCSLKLAIVLASAATLTLMAGSLVMHAHPRLFGGLDRMTMGDWFRQVPAGEGALTWWLPLTGGLLLLLCLNTGCCFLDWLRHINRRWRKSGEYLLHLGVTLVLVAWAWGNTAGFRIPDFRLAVGETRTIPQWPGYALRLESFEPSFSERGRPLDMASRVVLLQDDRTVAAGTVRFNQPLTHDGLAVLPASFGRRVEGYSFFLPGRGLVPLTPGTALQLDQGSRLAASRFFPHAGRTPEGRVVQLGDDLGNAAIELELSRPGQAPWRGWYFLREGIPFPLLQAGVRLWPAEPVSTIYSQLTVNRDPGAGLALAGAGAMLAGTLLAMVSFYLKRSRGDRPEVS